MMGIAIRSAMPMSSHVLYTRQPEEHTSVTSTVTSFVVSVGLSVTSEDSAMVHYNNNIIDS